MFARIENNAVRERVPFDPTGLFPKDFVWVECPDDTEDNATYDASTGKFTNPPSAETPLPGPVYRTVMTPIRFMAQFSFNAQVAIDRARAYEGDDPQKVFARDALNVLFKRLDDVRLTEVDVKDPAVIGGIDLVRSFDLITEEEATAIKRGIPE